MSDVRYWMAEPGGTPAGPYDLETLRDFRDQGRIGPNTQLCVDGGTAWQPAASVLGSVAPVTPPGRSEPSFGNEPWARAQPTSSATFGVPGDGAGALSMVGPIIATVGGALFSPCFIGMVLGIVAIVMTSGANEALKSGNIEAFRSKAQTAKTCTVIAYVLIAIGCVLNVAVIAMMLAGAGP